MIFQDGSMTPTSSKDLKVFLAPNDSRLSEKSKSDKLMLRYLADLPVWQHSGKCLHKKERAGKRIKFSHELRLPS